MCQPGDRTFSGFAAGTTGVGFDLKALSRNDSFSVTALTGSGTQTYTLTGTDTFFGLTDASGITSITMNNHGTASGAGNYSFDNISTFAPTTAAVPEAGTWSLMLTGFGTLGAASRSRRRVRGPA